MSKTDPDEMAAARVRALAKLSDAVLKQLAWLDLSDVQHRFAASPGVSLYAIWNLSVEYRRFLLLRLSYPERDIPAPPLIESYWRLHAADHDRFASDCQALTRGTDLSPDELAPPQRLSQREAGSEVRELYETIFPCGNAELWGWPEPEPGHRTSAPTLGLVHRRVPSAIDEPTRTRLRDEAFAQLRRLTESHSASTSVEDSSQAKQLPIQWDADRTPVMHEVHWAGRVPQLIAEQTGAIVSPRSAGYIYYRSGDFVGIHTDSYGDDLVLLTLLSGSVEPLHCHLHLADTPLAEIESLAESANRLPEGGTPLDINATPFLLSGQRIPHHRAPRERASETVVLAQFYGPLLPLPADALDQPTKIHQ